MTESSITLKYVLVQIDISFAFPLDFPPKIENSPRSKCQRGGLILSYMTNEGPWYYQFQTEVVQGIQISVMATCLPPFSSSVEH